MANIQLGEKLYEESGVKTPAGNEAEDAFDLELYRDATNSSRAFLAVNLSLQIFFKDHPANGGDWDFGSRQWFLDDYKAAVYSVWDNQWDIKCTSGNLAIETVEVYFYLKLIEGGWNWTENYEVTVTKMPKHINPKSDTNVLTKTVKLDSNDTNGVAKKGRHIGCSGASCGVMQRGAAHEFGHMLGLRDEYPGARNPIAGWEHDGSSIMFAGETVRPRHYAIFLPFLERAFAREARLTSRRVEFKVDGLWDLSNSRLGSRS